MPDPAFIPADFPWRNPCTPRRGIAHAHLYLTNLAALAA